MSESPTPQVKSLGETVRELYRHHLHVTQYWLPWCKIGSGTKECWENFAQAIAAHLHSQPLNDPRVQALAKMKTCPVCKADICSGVRDDDGVWHKAKVWGNPLKPIVATILQEALEHDNMFDLKEANTWNGDAHLTITLTVEDVCNLAAFAGYKFKPPMKTGAMRNTQRTVEPK